MHRAGAARHRHRADFGFSGVMARARPRCSKGIGPTERRRPSLSRNNKVLIRHRQDQLIVNGQLKVAIRRRQSVAVQGIHGSSSARVHSSLSTGRPVPACPAGADRPTSRRVSEEQPIEVGPLRFHVEHSVSDCKSPAERNGQAHSRPATGLPRQPNRRESYPAAGCMSFDSGLRSPQTSARRAP